MGCFNISNIYRNAGHGEESEDSDGEEVNRWNLRKCSAAGLDVLSTVFGEELLPIVTPIVQQRMQARLNDYALHPIKQCCWEYVEVTGRHIFCCALEGRPALIDSQHQLPKKVEKQYRTGPAAHRRRTALDEG